MTAIIDYGVGNLFSLVCSLGAIGEAAEVTRDAQKIAQADRVILPGVGAFADAAEKLESSGMRQVVKQAVEAGKPLLGICLGMQLLFEKSMEYGEHFGLGYIPGQVLPLEEHLRERVDIPHMGWNRLTLTDPRCPILEEIRTGEYVYFVHSYAGFSCEPYTAAVTEYGGVPVTAVVWNQNVFGTQFHPEKSGDVGLKILKAFCRLKAESSGK